MWQDNQLPKIKSFSIQQQTSREGNHGPTLINNNLKENKILGINLAKEMKELYNENLKLKKKTE